MLAFIGGFLFGVLTLAAFNYFFPEKVDKATKEIEDEINDRLRGD